jgi:hypothetical protein
MFLFPVAAAHLVRLAKYCSQPVSLSLLEAMWRSCLAARLLMAALVAKYP